MITEQQGQQQFEAADLLEEAVLKGRWKGIVAEKLWLIECSEGIMMEVELDKWQRGLRLIGTPDVTDDGGYQLSLQMAEGAKCANAKRIQQLVAPLGWGCDDPEVIASVIVANDAIWPTACALIDLLWNGGSNS